MKPLVSKKINLRHQGNFFESLALNYLVKHDLTYITRNFRCKLGEIDLILRDKTSLIFVEVKYRKTLAFGSPLESISTKKIQTIRKVAQYFMLTHPKLKLDPRFDVIGILYKPQETAGRQAHDISWIKHAF